jgi:hypothetical protein
MECLIDEPVELRDRMRELAAVAPAEARSRLALEVAGVAGEAVVAVAPALSTLDVEAVCVSYQRELWLWLVGERTWAQCVGGLTGRLLRRAAARNSSP